MTAVTVANDPAVVLADAEAHERALADHLLAIATELLTVQQLPWDAMNFDASVYAKLGRLSEEKHRAFTAWLEAHEATNAARAIWLQHI